MNKEVNLLSKNEDYLDQLLNQFSKSGNTKDDKHGNQVPQEIDLDLEDDEKQPSIKNNEDDFIRQFENEMDEFDSERLISEFEMELDQTLVEPDALSETDRVEKNIDTDFFAGLNEAMGRKDSTKEEAIDEELKDEENTNQQVEVDEKIEEVSADEEFVETESKEEPSKVRKQVNLDSDEDILELLSGLAGEDEELSDIANMLKADENHEPIQDNGILDMDQELKSIAEEDFDEDEEQEAKEEGTKKKKTKKIKKIKKENALLAKLSKTFFGEEEVEATQVLKIPVHELDGTETPEELEILENLNNADIVVKTEEEQAKEDKLKLAQEKKAEKQKAAQEKKKEKDVKKAENKAKKADKPIKVKAIDKTPPLPKVSVILIFLMSISLLAFVILATKVSGYQLAKSQTQELYKAENYVEAYAVIAGVELKKADEPLKEKVVLLAGLQEEFSAYTIYFKSKKYEQALDALVRGVGRYYDGLEAATTLEVVSEYGLVYAQLQEALSLNYKLADDEVIKLYQMKKRNLYSAELVYIVDGLTFQ